MSENGKILVTGASGFIGGRIVEVFHLAGAQPIRAGIRRWSSCARLGRFPVEITRFDLMETDQVERALDGVTAVVHCAKGTREETVQGTENLLNAALKQGVDRFVHFSTADVYGEASGEIDETFPFQSTGTEYSEMKIEAEERCWAFLEKGLPLTVLRPTIVYGPFSGGWTVSIAERLIQGVWGKFEKYGEGKCNLLYVDDLVRAVSIALRNENALGEAFNVSGPEVTTWNDYFDRFNRKLGLPTLREINTVRSNLRTQAMEPVRILGRFLRDHYAVPLKKLSQTFDLANTLMRRTEKAIKTTPAPAEMKLFGRDAVYRIEKARERIGFQPKTDIDSGLETTVQWLKHQGFLL